MERGISVNEFHNTEAQEIPPNLDVYQSSGKAQAQRRSNADEKTAGELFMGQIHPREPEQMEVITS